MHHERIWLIDTEGNGGHPSEIIELGLAEMVDLELTGLTYSWRFRPQIPVDRYATRVHGITDADLEHCPRITECIGEIAALIGTEAIAGHAVHVEMDALQRVMPLWQPIRAYDTLKIARRLHPDLERHRLSVMGDHLGVSGKAAEVTGGAPHCALYDAVLSGMILTRMISTMSEAERVECLYHSEIIEMRRKAEERRQRAVARKLIRRSLRRTSTGGRP